MIEVRDPITHNTVFLAERGCVAHREDLARRPAIAHVCHLRNAAAHAEMVDLLSGTRWIPRWP